MSTRWEESGYQGHDGVGLAPTRPDIDARTAFNRSLGAFSNSVESFGVAMSDFLSVFSRTSGSVNWNTSQRDLKKVLLKQADAETADLMVVHTLNLWRAVLDDVSRWNHHRLLTRRASELKAWKAREDDVQSLRQKFQDSLSQLDVRLEEVGLIAENSLRNLVRELSSLETEGNESHKRAVSRFIQLDNEALRLSSSPEWMRLTQSKIVRIFKRSEFRNLSLLIRETQHKIDILTLQSERDLELAVSKWRATVSQLESLTFVVSEIALKAQHFGSSSADRLEKVAIEIDAIEKSVPKEWQSIRGNIAA
jgi:hypothetical protein